MEKTKAGRYDIDLMEQNRRRRPGGGPGFTSILQGIKDKFSAADLWGCELLR